MSEKNIFVKIRSKKFQKRGDFSYWAQYDDFSRITLFSNFRAQCALSQTLSLSLLLPLNRLTERKQREWRERILTKGFFRSKHFLFCKHFIIHEKGQFQNEGEYKILDIAFKGISYAKMESLKLIFIFFHYTEKNFLMELSWER